MTRALCLIVLFAATASLGACVGSSDPWNQSASLPEDPNPFAYRTVEHDYDVQFAVNAAVPAPSEVKHVQGFLASVDARPGDHVAVSADATTLGEARREQVGQILSAAGLVPVSSSNPPADGGVTIAIQLTEVVPPDCSRWPNMVGDQPSNAPLAILGCSERVNLYNMVVDKRDLVEGRAPGVNDAEPGMRAVQTYREGKSPLSQNGGALAGGDSSAGAAASSATDAATGAASLANAGGGSGLPGSTGTTNGQ